MNVIVAPNATPAWEVKKTEPKEKLPEAFSKLLSSPAADKPGR